MRRQLDWHEFPYGNQQNGTPRKHHDRIQVATRQRRAVGGALSRGFESLPPTSKYGRSVATNGFDQVTSTLPARWCRTTELKHGQ